MAVPLRCLLGLLCLTLSQLVQAGQLPDSTRPGAIRPELKPRPDIPAPPPEEVLEIPAVIERPFDIEECPCVKVTRFHLIDAEEMPQFGIRLAEIEAILANAVRQQPPSGFSIGQLQEVANRVRNYYRKNGLILTQVVVPVQTVEAGVVQLDIFIGRLGRVLVEGNQIYRAETLDAVFEALKGAPIYQPDIEAALLRLTDFPGLSVFGVFQPGQAVGTSDIVLKVQDEKRFDLALRADNHGTRETGKDRTRVTFDINNFASSADVLSIGLQRAFNPKNNDFIAIDYSNFLGEGKYQFNAFYNINDFDVGGEFAAANISAETDIAGMSLEKSIIRSRLNNLTARFAFSREKSLTLTAGAQTNIDRLAVLTAAIDFDTVDSFTPLGLFDPEVIGGGINIGSVEFSRGLEDFLGLSMGSSADAALRPVGEQPSRQGGPTNPAFASGKFDKIFAYFTRLQTLTDNANLLIRAEYQWSPDLLVPLQQYSVGGPDNVRAFPVAQVLWDRAIFFSSELLINIPFIRDRPAFANRTWGELVQLGLFYDMAVGRLNAPLPAPADQQGYQNLNGAGIGLRFTLPGTIEARFFAAWELGGDPVGNDKEPQLWGDLTISF